MPDDYQDRPYEWLDCDAELDPLDVAAISDLEGADELDRQARIARGLEHACAVCGCSESRACPGGCVWATGSLCSRCAASGRALIL